MNIKIFIDQLLQRRSWPTCRYREVLKFSTSRYKYLLNTQYRTTSPSYGTAPTGPTRTSSRFPLV